MPYAGGLRKTAYQPFRLSCLGGFAGLVADSSYGHHNLRVLGIPLDLGTQSLHVNVDQPRVSRMAVSPHLFQQDLTTEDLPRPSCQGQQEIELQRCELDLHPITFDRMLVNTD